MNKADQCRPNKNKWENEDQNKHNGPNRNKFNRTDQFGPYWTD